MGKDANGGTEKRTGSYQFSKSGDPIYFKAKNRGDGEAWYIVVDMVVRKKQHKGREQTKRFIAN
jgi:hypothetical protein